MSKFSIITGDCLKAMSEMESNSIDAVISDPPYGLSFMGQKSDRCVPGIPYWERALRVAKPGSMLLAFGGTRTFHRLTCAIEDAGWQIRDCLCWLYGSGFPKSTDISKAIDKKAGEFDEAVLNIKKTLIRLFGKSGKTRSQIDKECGFRASNYLTLPKEGKRFDPWVDILPVGKKWEKIKEVLGVGPTELDPIIMSWEKSKAGAERKIIGSKKVIPGVAFTSEGPGELDITLPATPDAETWNGWGTALKPAYEPIILAMKPLDGTFAQNALKWGVAGLWIDGGRIGTAEELHGGSRKIGDGKIYGKVNKENEGGEEYRQNGKGRWPANLILDEEAAEMLDRQSGHLHGLGELKRDSINNRKGEGVTGFPEGDKPKGKYPNDSGGASRFFYTAKASVSEREAGLELIDPVAESYVAGRKLGSPGTKFSARVGRNEKPRRNRHATVKPVALMQYLCRLVRMPTPGTILDPFCGSGSTGIAALREGFDFVGIELDPSHAETARKRIQGDAPLLNQAQHG